MFFVHVRQGRYAGKKAGLRARWLMDSGQVDRSECHSSREPTVAGYRGESLR